MAGEWRYLHNGISYTGKMTSLCWIRALAAMQADIGLGGIIAG